MATNQLSNLRPCPFCGGTKICTEKGINLNYCDNCSAESNVEHWNTRPIEDALRAEIARLRAKFDTTDKLLSEATSTIGAVIACCTYNSNDDAKIGIYGIDQKAFTRIDQFIIHYIDAVSAGKVSVDVKRELTDAEIEELGAQEAEKRDKK